LTTEKTPSADRNRGGWFKSSYSNAGGSCVETWFKPGTTLVRDSKDRRNDSPSIALSPVAWTAFLDAVTHPAPMEIEQ
jgi:hypothetical protein